MNQNKLKIPWLDAIRYRRLRIYYQVIAPIKIKSFIGPYLRSGIGHILK